MVNELSFTSKGVNYMKDPFMNVADFINETITMTHPYYWTIIKL